VTVDPPPPILDIYGFPPLGSPNDDLVGVRVFSPGWGTCWLGMKSDAEGITFWHVTDGGRTEIDYDAIQAYPDPMTGNVWIIFYRSHDDSSFPILRFTGEEPGYGYYIPPLIRRMLE